MKISDVVKEKLYEYIGTSNQYRVTAITKIKLNGHWENYAVVYEDVKSGSKYARLIEDFASNFEPSEYYNF